MNGREPLLRVPPFPGAKIHTLVRPRTNPAQCLSDDDIDRLVERIRQLAVGGDYWTGEPDHTAFASGAASEVRDRFRKQVLEPFEHVSPFNGETMAIADAVELCGFWRKLIDANRDLRTAVGFAFWKRPTVAPLLWGGSADVNFASRLKDVDTASPVAIWKARTPPRFLTEIERAGAKLVEVEDGFIRSAGLGADCVPPLSIVVDRLGAHFDPTGPSDLEQLIQDGPFSADLVQRAARLRALIVASGIGKYGAGSGSRKRHRADCRTILVPGQVEDDRAVLCGAGSVRTNLELLRQVREANANAHIVYKPHPDVEAGHRVGVLTAEDCLSFANEIVRDEPISGLIECADEIHTISSLAGFEALLRGKQVTAYGAPFYAGWGLTRDLGPVPVRRTSRRNLDELVAAVLLLYPRYLDPVSGLPCPPEILIHRLAEGTGQQGEGMVVQLRRLQGRWKRFARAGNA